LLLTLFITLRVSGCSAAKVIHCCWFCEETAWTCRWFWVGWCILRLTSWWRSYLFLSDCFVWFNDVQIMHASVQKRGYVDLQEMVREDSISCCYGTTLLKDPTFTLPSSWATADPSSFLIRGKNYLEDQKKVWTRPQFSENKFSTYRKRACQ